jgi:hypothetical protein
LCINDIDHVYERQMNEPESAGKDNPRGNIAAHLSLLNIALCRPARI